MATVGDKTGPLAALAFSPAARQLAYLNQDGAVTVVDLADPARHAHTGPMRGITPSAGHSFAFTYSPNGTRLTAVAVGSYQLATCTWNVTNLSQPLPSTCRTGHTHLDGGITFTSARTAIVGPNNHWANRGQDPLIIWPTLLG